MRDAYGAYGLLLATVLWVAGCSSDTPTSTVPTQESATALPAPPGPSTAATWRTLAITPMPGDGITFGGHDPAGGRVNSIGFARAEQVKTAGLALSRYLKFSADAPGTYAVYVTVPQAAVNEVSRIRCRNYPNNVFESGEMAGFSPQYPNTLMLPLRRLSTAAQGEAQESLFVTCELALKDGNRAPFNDTRLTAVIR